MLLVVYDTRRYHAPIPRYYHFTANVTAGDTEKSLSFHDKH